MTTRDDFIQAIRTATEGTPYDVTPTDAGFDLGLKLADAKWYGLFNKSGLQVEHVCRVRLDGDSYTIEQGMREVSWSLGAPTRGRLEFFKGRSYEVSFQKVWALDEGFRPAKVVDYSFSSNEGLALVRTVGKRLGLKERMPGVVKGAIIVGLLGASSIVLVPIGLIGKARGWWG